jgi:hypothetical protein
VKVALTVPRGGSGIYLKLAPLPDLFRNSSGLPRLDYRIFHSKKHWNVIIGLEGVLA